MTCIPRRSAPATQGDRCGLWPVTVIGIGIGIGKVLPSRRHVACAPWHAASIPRFTRSAWIRPILPDRPAHGQATGQATVQATVQARSACPTRPGQRLPTLAGAHGHRKTLGVTGPDGSATVASGAAKSASCRVVGVVPDRFLQWRLPRRFEPMPWTAESACPVRPVMPGGRIEVSSWRRPA